MGAPRASELLPAFFAELDAWTETAGVPFETVSYGDDPDQEYDLRTPHGDGRHPVAIVIHGGFWRAGFTRATTGALASALTLAGWTTANIEYRRLGPGRHRELLDDVLAAAGGLEADIAIGHSAGGHLALWLAAQQGAGAAVALGGVCDLEAAARDRVGADAVQELLGGEPEQVPDAYALADPGRMLPLRSKQVLIHGAHDDRVPIENARTYAERARRAGDDCRLLELEDAGHFDVIDPRYEGFSRIVAAIPR
jgi:acetyl esterase/lipase